METPLVFVNRKITANSSEMYLLYFELFSVELQSKILLCLYNVADVYGSTFITIITCKRSTEIAAKKTLCLAGLSPMFPGVQLLFGHSKLNFLQ